MPKFRVCCEWEMCGEFEVEADSLEKAISQVANCEEPYDCLPDGEYIDDSFSINYDCCGEIE